MTKKRIAIVGGGIAGLSAAWLLKDRYAVTLFEKNAYIGGHSNTLTVDTAQGPVAIDTGFVVYNERNYPLLTALFATLGVRTQATDMSFAASIDDGRLEYAGSGLKALFAQRSNLLRPAHWRMLKEILRFNHAAKHTIKSGDARDLSLGEYLARGGYGPELANHYLLPMAAAIWSCPTPTMREFPATSFLHFFENHGLLDLKNRPQWRTVVGGSRSYVQRMLEDIDAVQRSCGARAIRRDARGVHIHTEDGQARHFDEVVLACHADEALGLVQDATPDERALLGSFAYQENRTLLHSDAALMPRREAVWSSWNYLARSRDKQTQAVSVSYWMNRLHRLEVVRQFFVSLNPLREPRAETLIAEMSYHHPVFNQAAIAAQARLHEIQGVRGTWFCGSYAGYGFHEDALRSSVNVARALGVEPPWATRKDTNAKPLRQAAALVLPS